MENVFCRFRWALTQGVLYWSIVGTLWFIKTLTLMISTMLANFKKDGGVAMILIVACSLFDLICSFSTNILTGGSIPS